MNSNLGKVFCSIMSKSQIGFIPKHHTADHIYSLHTLIDKHVHQNNNKMYACFIDFQKTFDSIWHAGLFYKVIESGVYDLIKSMYTGNTCGIKIVKKIS